MIETAIAVCMGILAAAFLLGTRVGSAILTLLILGFAAFLIWLFWGPTLTNFVRTGAGLFLLALVLGGMSVGIKKLTALLNPLLPPPFGTKGKPEAQTKAADRHPNSAE